MITTDDIIYRLSGGASNTNPNASLGGAMSTVSGGIIPKTKTLNSLFDDIGSAEAIAGDTEFRCIYVQNINEALTLLSARIWIYQNTPSTGTTMQLGAALQGVDGEASTIADESTAPSPAVTFAETCVGYSTGIYISDLVVNGFHGIWLKRIATAGVVVISDDNFILKVQGITDT